MRDLETQEEQWFLGIAGEIGTELNLSGPIAILQEVIAQGGNPQIVVSESTLSDFSGLDASASVSFLIMEGEFSTDLNGCDSISTNFFNFNIGASMSVGLTMPLTNENGRLIIMEQTEQVAEQVVTQNPFSRFLQMLVYRFSSPFNFFEGIYR